MEPPTLVNTPVKNQRVKVNVEIERPAEALDDDDRAPTRVVDAGVTGQVTQEAKDGAHGHGHHRPTDVMVPGQQVPHPVWKREHPLANGDVGEHMIEKCAARSVIRRPPQLGHTALALHENAISRSVPQ